VLYVGQEAIPGQLVGDTVKVADFGLCAVTGFETGLSGFRGTPPYAAPELYEGRTTSRTDQYALAVTFCELCMGPRAFVKDCNGFPCFRGPPIDLTRLRDPEFLVVGRALSERWIDRYPSCREFVAALKRASCSPRRVHRAPAAGVSRYDREKSSCGMQPVRGGTAEEAHAPLETRIDSALASSERSIGDGSRSKKARSS